MTEELQNLTWSRLPKEFKEEVKKEYAKCVAIDMDDNPNLPAYAVESATSRRALLEMLFGEHNLTSDAEGEDDEMLHVSRKKLQYFYEMLRKVGENHAAFALQSLFGSKCLPDESESPILSKVEKIGKDCKAEPKFKLGDVVRIKPNAAEYHQGYQNGYAWTPERYKYVGKVFLIINIWETGTIVLNTPDNAYWESIDLEPYTEPLSQNPTESCDNENVISRTDTCTNVCPSPRPSQEESDRDLCDKLIHRGFKNHNRLHVASIVMAGLLASGKDKHPVKRALELADALIAEAEKGGKQ